MKQVLLAVILSPVNTKIPPALWSEEGRLKSSEYCKEMKSVWHVHEANMAVQVTSSSFIRSRQQTIDSLTHLSSTPLRKSCSTAMYKQDLIIKRTAAVVVVKKHGDKTLSCELCVQASLSVCTRECEGVVKQRFPASQSVSRETRRAPSALSPLCGLTLLCCWEWKGFREQPIVTVQSHRTTASYSYMEPSWACAVAFIMKRIYTFPQPLFYIANETSSACAVWPFYFLHTINCELKQQWQEDKI